MDIGVFFARLYSDMTGYVLCYDKEVDFFFVLSRAASLMDFKTYSAACFIILNSAQSSNNKALCWHSNAACKEFYINILNYIKY